MRSAISDSHQRRYVFLLTRARFDYIRRLKRYDHLLDNDACKVIHYGERLVCPVLDTLVRRGNCQDLTLVQSPYHPDEPERYRGLTEHFLCSEREKLALLVQCLSFLGAKMVRIEKSSEMHQTRGWRLGFRGGAKVKGQTVGAGGHTKHDQDELSTMCLNLTREYKQREPNIELAERVLECHPNLSTDFPQIHGLISELKNGSHTTILDESVHFSKEARRDFEFLSKLDLPDLFEAEIDFKRYSREAEQTSEHILVEFY